VHNVSFVVCYVLCFVLARGVTLCDVCICEWCPIVVPLPQVKNRFTVKINNNNNKRNRKIYRILLGWYINLTIEVLSIICRSLIFATRRFGDWILCLSLTE
jgi:hypothetical protein